MKDRMFVFDSYALLALLEEEPGASVVAGTVSGESTEIYLSTVNLGEVYYIVFRRHGEAAAEEVVQAVMQEESIHVVEASWPRVKEAARIKAGGGLSYADSFVLGLCLEVGAPAVTGDPEIRAAAEKIGAEIVWIGR